MSCLQILFLLLHKQVLFFKAMREIISTTWREVVDVMEFKAMRALCIKEKIQLECHFTHQNGIYQFTIYSNSITQILQNLEHSSIVCIIQQSNIHFHPSFNLQYQLRVIILPEITCKDTLDNNNNKISNLKVMHKNLKLILISTINP